MLLHAAFAVLLARWSGQNDIVVGTVLANRTHSELEPLIGCFVNTLALRTQLKTGESFTNLLTRVRESDLAAYAHQALPFEQLVEALQPERSRNQSPIFQTSWCCRTRRSPRKNWRVLRSSRSRSSWGLRSST